VQAAYGYTAYGANNATLTKTTAAFDPAKPNLNAYRYTGKRFDTGSDTYDMGARRYSPSTGRFMQQDIYYGALANLGLASYTRTDGRFVGFLEPPR
jgi:RHS repeat-associated protein